MRILLITLLGSSTGMYLANLVLYYDTYFNKDKKVRVMLFWFPILIVYFLTILILL